MAKLVTFTDQELATLRDLVQYLRNNPINKGQDTETPINPAPDVYIAYIGASGIAARSGLTIQSGLCNVYTLVDGKLLSTSIYPKKVFNLSAVAIAGDQYTVVRKEKFGQFVISCPCG